MEGKAVKATRRVITPVAWAMAPDWLTLEQAATLTGWSLGELRQIIEEGGLDLKDGDALLIEKQALYEFQETLAELGHWEE
jgi:hypothetical protein